jgi:tetratricopeptide (TPR) repeat protein
MSRTTIVFVFGISLFVGVAAFAQSEPQENNPPPRSDDSSGRSSSKDRQVDLSPPKGDAASHPTSEVPSDVNEMRTYDPHKADKNIEVGDYHLKRKHYRAAESRYREALEWKPGDAEATYNLAFCEEKLGKIADARADYESYLKILPHGPNAEESKKAIERLSNAAPAVRTTASGNLAK